ALLIESDGLPAIAGPHVHGIAAAAVMLADKPDHLPAIAFSLALRLRGDVLQLALAVLTRLYHAHCAHLSTVLQNEHLSLIQIPVDHVLLRVRKEQKVQVLL